MAVIGSIPALGTVIISAAIDSINPCAIGVLILMISVLLGSRASTKRMLLLGTLYISTVFMTYLLAGLGLIYFFVNMPLLLTEYISIGVGTLIVLAGLIEMKDFFWYGRGFSLSIPPEYAKKLHDYTKHATIPGVLFVGFFVAGVELPCTGAPYLAIITLLSQYFDATAVFLLILYNLIFVAPLFIILFLVAAGKKIYDIKRWKQKNKPYMRLVSGVLLIAMGWLLILIANGIINLG